MSRIGKMPIIIPSGVDVTIDGQNVGIKGLKGVANIKLPEELMLKSVDNKLQLIIKDVEVEADNLHGLFRSLLSNMVIGVTEEWKKTLELNGTGYRANVTGTDLQLALGFSHPVVIKAPPGIKFEVNENKIKVIGTDKSTVGELAAKIRGLRPADPYKTKGFKYEGEVIIRKAGKAAKAGGTTTK